MGSWGRADVDNDTQSSKSFAPSVRPVRFAGTCSRFRIPHDFGHKSRKSTVIYKRKSGCLAYTEALMHD